MGKIELLSDELISKIAAGEVIERPASVVKELLENSLDAKTDSIEIELEKAGKTLIQVKDTGTGIDEDDLKKIFLRHSTSKIRTSEDLFNINSLGFRGEALYSIQAISDITIKSKTADIDMGWQVHTRGGSPLSVNPYTMNKGTTIEVRELFFNTPARKKFLKTDATELNQILSIVVPYSILYPNIRFSLSNNNRSILDLNNNASRLERMAKVLNIDKNNLITKKTGTANDPVKIDLILGNINIQRVKRDMQFIFVNGRPVSNRTISFHINQIYKLIFPQNIQPCFACFIELPNQDIDVNIHPTKREINLKNERFLVPLLRRTCENALIEHGSARSIVIDKRAEASTQKLDANTKVEDQTTGLNVPYDKSMEKLEKELSKISDTTFEQKQDDIPVETEKLSRDPKQYVLFTGNKEVHNNNLPVLETTLKKTLNEKLTNAAFIGIFMNKYLLFQSIDTMLVIDQHAAQERITYENLLQQLLSKKIEVQRLLVPIIIDLSSQEFVSWEAQHKNLEKIGFDTTQMKGHTIAIHSHPALIRKPDIAVMNILASDETLSAVKHPRSDTYNADDIARRACRKSVKAGDILKKDEATGMRDQLLNCENPFTCPHGRPTIIEITDKFLEKQFLRQI